MQGEKVITYSSKQLHKHEQHCHTHDLELETIFHALKIWRRCLFEYNCDIYTDHKILKYIIADWVEYETKKMTQVNKGLWSRSTYHLGKASLVVDALSKNG